MNILITGAKGMLGRTLQREFAACPCCPTDRDGMDITDAGQVQAVIGTVRPDVVLHCAAMTAVDLCQSQRDQAFRVNADGSASVAKACADVGARLVAFSTDYVFAGDARRPYREEDIPAPRTVYGQSKLAGEEAIRSLCPRHLILRVAWLYGPGGPSFLHTMLGLARSATPLRVVDDQRGNPTSTLAVAAHTALLLQTELAGTLHLGCEGDTTWFGFAQEIFRQSGLPVEAEACPTADYPRPAPRPADSRLENHMLKKNGLRPMPHWQEALQRFLQEYPHG